MAKEAVKGPLGLVLLDMVGSRAIMLEGFVRPTKREEASGNLWCDFGAHLHLHDCMRHIDAGLQVHFFAFDLASTQPPRHREEHKNDSVPMCKEDYITYWSQTAPRYKRCLAGNTAG